MAFMISAAPMEGGRFDAAVIGAGHAGLEAALALSGMGLNTALLTLNLDSIGMMPCNPAIGGTGKGHLVREIDALGGEMALAADDTLIQMRMLNTGKGPAVHSLRAQMDKRRYHERMKSAVEKKQNLTLIQGEAVDIATESGRVSGVITAEGFFYRCRAVILCAGVYMKARILIGEFSRESGPNGMLRSETLSEGLARLGIPLQRFKTGTPARVHGDTLHYERMQIQEGDVPTPAFSFLNRELHIKQDPCYLTYTNTQTHRIILDNLDRSPMYSGKIHATGTRYCPSIEDKVVKFADKDRHQIFIEPEGRSTREMYVQGLSTSLPADVQEKMIRTLPGLEDCRILRYGYAIEYDCIDPLVLTPTFSVKGIEGLYSAGQMNGTSGYEEAAAQGLYAGINAGLYLKNEPPLLLKRSDAYIGVLADDLVTKGTKEPYRMMTSRCEYRLLLRQDNADARLTEIGRRTGLISDERYAAYRKKTEKVQAVLSRLDRTVPPEEKLIKYLESIGENPPKTGVKLSELLKRPAVTYSALLQLYGGEDGLLPADRETEEQLDVLTRYAGYIEKQQEQVERMLALENMPLPQDTDYMHFDGLRLEARQKLAAVKPASLGQASRISGVSPADITVLMIALRARGR